MQIEKDYEIEEQPDTCGIRVSLGDLKQVLARTSIKPCDDDPSKIDYLVIDPNCESDAKELSEKEILKYEFMSHALTEFNKIFIVSLAITDNRPLDCLFKSKKAEEIAWIRTILDKGIINATRDIDLFTEKSIMNGSYYVNLASEIWEYYFPNIVSQNSQAYKWLKEDSHLKSLFVSEMSRLTHQWREYIDSFPNKKNILPLFADPNYELILDTSIIMNYWIDDYLKIQVPVTIPFMLRRKPEEFTDNLGNRRFKTHDEYYLLNFNPKLSLDSQYPSFADSLALFIQMQAAAQFNIDNPEWKKNNKKDGKEQTAFSYIVHPENIPIRNVAVLSMSHNSSKFFYMPDIISERPLDFAQFNYKLLSHLIHGISNPSVKQRMREVLSKKRAERKKSRITVKWG